MTMSNIRFLSSVLVLCLFGVVDAYAAPTVKKLGANTARIGANTTVVNAPYTSSSAQRLGTIRKIQSTSAAPVTVNNSTTTQNLSAAGDTSRLGMGKYISVPGVATAPVIAKIPAAQQKPAVSSDDFINLSDRVSDLETDIDFKQDALSVGNGLILEDNLLELDDEITQMPEMLDEMSGQLDELADNLDGLSAQVEGKVSTEELNENYYTINQVNQIVNGITVEPLNTIYDSATQTRKYVSIIDTFDEEVLNN